MEDAQGVKVVRAHVPLSGIFGYIGDLRSKTQGRAVYSMTFNSYAEVPKAVADEIIQKSRGEESPGLSTRQAAKNQVRFPCGTHLVRMAGTLVPARFRPSARTGSRH